MPLTEREYAQIETAIKAAHGVNIAGIYEGGPMDCMAKNNVLAILSNYREDEAEEVQSQPVEKK